MPEFFCTIHFLMCLVGFLSDTSSSLYVVPGLNVYCFFLFLYESISKLGRSQLFMSEGEPENGRLLNRAIKKLRIVGYSLQVSSPTADVLDQI